MTSLYHVPGGGYYDRPISSTTNALGQRVDHVGGTLRDANGNDLLVQRTSSRLKSSAEENNTQPYVNEARRMLTTMPVAKVEVPSEAVLENRRQAYAMSRGIDPSEYLSNDAYAKEMIDSWRRGSPLTDKARNAVRDYLMRQGFYIDEGEDFQKAMSRYVSGLNSAAQKSAFTSETKSSDSESTSTTPHRLILRQPPQPIQYPQQPQPTQPEQPQTIHVGGEKPKKPTDPSAWVRYKPVRTRKVAKVPTIDDIMPGVKTLI